MTSTDRFTRHAVPGITLLLLSVIAARAGAAQRCGAGTLRLEERAVQALPPHYGVEGAVALGGGGYALWTAEGTILSVYPEGVRQRRTLPPPLKPVGLTPEADGFRFLDRGSGVEYRLGADSLPVRTGAIVLARGEEVDAARWYRGAWIVALRDLGSRRFVVRRVAMGGATTLYVSPAADSVHHIPRYLLGESGGSLLLTRLTAPFELLLLDPTTGVLDTLARPLTAAALRAALPDSLEQWRALPAVTLDCGWLLTLSDLRSDRRLLLRYDLERQLARVTELEAPFGVMAGRLDESTLLAARRAGGLELVWYAWRWIRDAP